MNFDQNQLEVSFFTVQDATQLQQLTRTGIIGLGFFYFFFSVRMLHLCLVQNHFFYFIFIFLLLKRQYVSQDSRLLCCSVSRTSQ